MHSRVLVLVERLYSMDATIPDLRLHRLHDNSQLFLRGARAGGLNVGSSVGAAAITRRLMSPVSRPLLWIRCPQGRPETAAFRLLLGDFQPFPAPDAIDALDADARQPSATSISRMRR